MQKKKLVVIGLVGETASGKDTVANYLHHKYNAQLFRFADPLKKTLALFSDKTSKEDHAWLYLMFKQRFGEDILHHALKREMMGRDGLFCVNGLRMPKDVEFIRSFGHHSLLYITAPQRLRWERSTKRGEKADDATGFENFKEFEESTETEKHIPVIGAQADYVIQNDKDLERLLVAVDDYMEKVKM